MHRPDDAGRKFGELITAMVTPFRDDRIDETAFVALAERQLAAGIKGLLVASGMAGEAATLRPEEARRLIDLCIRTVRGRATVVVDASSNSTAAAVSLVRQAQDLGADGVLVTTPWYNRPNQEGLFRHYQAVAEAAAIPILVGHDPHRTRVEVSVDLLARLADLPNLAGLVDASGDLVRLGAIRRSCPTWRLFSNDESRTLGFLASGGNGVTSVTANIAPQAMIAFARAVAHRDWAAAQTWQDRLYRLHAGVADGPCPSGAKLALSRLGLCRPDVRLPMLPGSAAAEEELSHALLEAGLTASG